MSAKKEERGQAGLKSKETKEMEETKEAGSQVRQFLSSKVREYKAERDLRRAETECAVI